MDEEDRRAEFRKYLEQTKLTEMFTEALTELYEMPSRPEHPALFVAEKLKELDAKAKESSKK